MPGLDGLGQILYRPANTVLQPLPLAQRLARLSNSAKSASLLFQKTPLPKISPALARGLWRPLASFARVHPVMGATALLLGGTFILTLRMAPSLLNFATRPLTPLAVDPETPEPVYDDELLELYRDCRSLSLALYQREASKECSSDRIRELQRDAENLKSNIEDLRDRLATLQRTGMLKREDTGQFIGMAIDTLQRLILKHLAPLKHDCFEDKRHTEKKTFIQVRELAREALEELQSLYKTYGGRTLSTVEEMTIMETVLGLLV